MSINIKQPIFTFCLYCGFTLRLCILGTYNICPNQTPAGQILLFGVSPVNYSDYILVINFSVISGWSHCIRKTYPCNIYPLIPHFHIAKLGYARVYLFFLFLLQNIDCGYSLEPPQRGHSNVYPQSMF